MGTLLSPSQECHPFYPSSLSHDLVVSPHDLYTESLAEALMRAEQGGAVAVWASSGLTYPDQQHMINEELIRQLLSSEKITIGQAAARAKAAADDENVRRTWILFGDPATRLKY